MKGFQEDKWYFAQDFSVVQKWQYTMAGIQFYFAFRNIVWRTTVLQHLINNLFAKLNLLVWE